MKNRRAQKNVKEIEHPVFIIGSPRSGTTLLGELIDIHPEAKLWFEPYFIWDKYFRLAEDDVRKFEDATPEVISYIRRSFKEFAEKSSCFIVIDKSPRNSLKIPFIRRIFPKARFIHIYRDGRDSTLSIHKEWLKKIYNNKNFSHSIADNIKNNLKKWQLYLRWLNMQPFIKDRFKTLWFESHGKFFVKEKSLNRLRWKGRVGWGPRFAGWETAFQSHSLLQFNALQWQMCVSSILDYWHEIPSEFKLAICYEALLKDPHATVKQILEFIGIGYDSLFESKMPEIKSKNFNKWKVEFSQKQIEEIRALLTPNLRLLGYIENNQW